jgi:hypothetical protein
LMKLLASFKNENPQYRKMKLRIVIMMQNVVGCGW